jgi:NADP-dependent alcohol dehydrogenase
MENFTYHNPVKLVFGKGSIAQLSKLIPAGVKVLVTYGGGSVKKNGVWEQVQAALAKHSFVEFGGIEANPRYETLMKAVEICRSQKIDFLLSVGGGSVLDGTKFISAAVNFADGDPWTILSENKRFGTALPIGCVLTLPATGSEMNGNSVVSRNSTQEKLAFWSPLVYPKFSILDPETTFSLPERQTANGIVDAFIHVMEQYLTYPANGPLQDRQAEAILSTLIEEGPKALQNPKDYNVRANIMWCATQALNGLISVGVPGDWTSHGIGHELTAFYGIDHAQSLAVVFPGVCHQQFDNKLEKLAQYGHRVWGLNGNPRAIALEAIVKTEEFFTALGAPTRLSLYQIDADEAANKISVRFTKRGSQKMGERGEIGPTEVSQIIKSRA